MVALRLYYIFPDLLIMPYLLSILIKVFVSLT